MTRIEPEPESDVGSDQWMRDRGFTPMTPEQSKAHAHFFECAEPAPHGGKIIDLLATLQKALNKHILGRS